MQKSHTLDGISDTKVLKKILGYFIVLLTSNSNLKMKSILIASLIVVSLFSCKNDDSVNNTNPYLLSNPLVSAQLNLSLPQYDPLKFPGGSVILSQQGIEGVIIYNVNNSLYTAFELSDPNHLPNNCSQMTMDGIIATCPCPSDTNEYEVVTGQNRINPSLYPMQQYRAIRTGDVVQVSN